MVKSMFYNTWNPIDLCFDTKRHDKTIFGGWLVVQNRGHSGSRCVEGL